MPGVKKLAYGEGSIEKRTDARGRLRYRGRITLDTGRASTVWYAKRDDAVEALQRLREDEPEEEVPTLGEWLDEWLLEYAPAGEKSNDENRQWAIDKLAPLHHLQLDEVMTRTINRHLQRLASGKSRLAKDSLIRVRSVLGQALDEALAQRVISAEYGNAARLATIPKTAVPRRRRRTLTTKQAAALQDAARSDPLEIAVYLMLWLGLRPQEARALQWSTVHLDQATPTIDVIWAKGESQRPLALPLEVVAAFRRQQTNQTKAKLRCRPGVWIETGLVVTSEVGTMVDRHNLLRTVRRLANDAGIFWKQPLVPYELRHTAGSLLVEAGMPLEEVSDLLGHKDTRMLVETYRHRSKRTVDLRDAMRKTFAS